MPNSDQTANVLIEDEIKFGVFANAFRVVEESGPDCFLDFMEYSAAEKEARVVARVRVRRDFLRGIEAKIGDAIVLFGVSEPPDEGEAPYRKAIKTIH